MKFLKKRAKWRIRTPVILQIEAIECGAVSLGIILKYFGKIVSMGELRTRCAVSRDGSNGLDLVKAARYYQLEAKGIQTTREGLEDLKTPAILYWEHSHFVVLEGFIGERAYINDPAFGPISMPIDEFDQKFSHVALVMHRSPEFQKSKASQGIWSLLLKIWKGTHFFYLAIGSLAALLPTLGLPLVLRTLIDHSQFSNMHVWKWRSLAILLFALILGAYYTILNHLVLNRLSFKISENASMNFLSKLLRLPLSFYQQREAADLARRTELIKEIYSVLIKTITPAGMQMILSLAYAAILFTYNPLVALITLSGALTCSIAMFFIHRARVMNTLFFEKYWKANEALVLENFISLEPIKASGGESAFFDRWAGSYIRFLNTQQRFDRSEALISAFPYFTRFFCLSLLLISGYIDIVRGNLRIGMLVAAILLLFLFLDSWFRMIRLSEVFIKIQRSLNRIEDVESAEEDLLFKRTNVENRNGRIEFKNIAFGYYPYSPPQLLRVSFDLVPGKRIGITGPAGSGKSTLGKIAALLLHPSEGTIQINGSPIAYDLALRRTFCWLGEDSYLFAGTLRNNLTLWDPNVSNERIEKAIASVGLEEWAAKRGLEFLIAENGNNLSRAEKQQIEIARGFLSDFSYLILDEAMGALNPELQMRILKNLTANNPACLIISHERHLLSTCDEILVLDQNTIVERGTDSSLMAKETLYQRLFA